MSPAMTPCEADPATLTESTVEARGRPDGQVALVVYTPTGRDTGRLTTLVMTRDDAATLGRQLIDLATAARAAGGGTP